MLPAEVPEQWMMLLEEDELMSDGRCSGTKYLGLMLQALVMKVGVRSTKVGTKSPSPIKRGLDKG